MDHSTCIVFIDDEQAVLDGIRRLLSGHRHDWKHHYANSVDEGISLAQRVDADLIITDMNMRGKTGLDLLNEVRAHDQLCFVPVIVLTGNAEANLKQRALEHGALDLLNKPVSREDLIARITSAVRLSRSERQLREHAKSLEEHIRIRTMHLEYSRIEIIWRLARAGEMRDTDTGDHVARVAECAMTLALEMGMTSKEAETLHLASTLHDVGKVSLPDSILRKPGALTPEEIDEMREHCRRGHALLTSPIPISAPSGYDNHIIRVAARVVLSHHERWDGLGYPERLVGDQIPIEARIVAFADALDALSQRRSYKDAMPFDAAFSILEKDSGKHFDPEVVRAARARKEQLRAVIERAPNREHLHRTSREAA